jgi:hypothetical protein
MRNPTATGRGSARKKAESLPDEANHRSNRLLETRRMQSTRQRKVTETCISRNLGPDTRSVGADSEPGGSRRTRRRLGSGISSLGSLDGIHIRHRDRARRCRKPRGSRKPMPPERRRPISIDGANPIWPPTNATRRSEISTKPSNNSRILPRRWAPEPGPTAISASGIEGWRTPIERSPWTRRRPTTSSHADRAFPTKINTTSRSRALIGRSNSGRALPVSPTRGE